LVRHKRGEVQAPAISLDAIEQLQVSVALTYVNRALGSGINAMTKSGSNRKKDLFTSSRSNKKSFTWVQKLEIPEIVPGEIFEKNSWCKLGSIVK
jgi:hypothetical protein